MQSFSSSKVSKRSYWWTKQAVTRFGKEISNQWAVCSKPWSSTFPNKALNNLNLTQHRESCSPKTLKSSVPWPLISEAGGLMKLPAESITTSSKSSSLPSGITRVWTSSKKAKITLFKLGSVNFRKSQRTFWGIITSFPWSKSQDASLSIKSHIPKLIRNLPLKSSGNFLSSSFSQKPTKKKPSRTIDLKEFSASWKTVNF